MAKSKEPAFVLADFHIREAQTFSGFPGAYMPGVPVPVSSLGVSLEEGRELIKALGLPLTETTADVEQAQEPEPPAAEPAPEPEEEA